MNDPRRSEAIRAALKGYEPTDEQWRAISHPLEPLYLIAGAGSGKTAVMAARIAWADGQMPVLRSLRDRFERLHREALEIYLAETPAFGLYQQVRIVPYNQTYWTNWPTTTNLANGTNGAFIGDDRGTATIIERV